MFFKKRKNRADDVVDTDNTPTEKQQEEEWIWVEGYKGLNSDMTGYGGFQFELGTTYFVDGPVQMCENGFHLCLRLTDVLKYYNWIDDTSYRYFKVKALVKKADKERCGIYTSCYARIDKLVAKQIVLTEEVTESSECIEAIKMVDNLYIDNLEEFQSMRKIGYEQHFIKKFAIMLQDKYSFAFADVLVHKLFSGSSCPTPSDINYAKSIINEAIAYYEEGVSKDIAVYLLMKDL